MYLARSMPRDCMHSVGKRTFLAPSQVQSRSILDISPDYNTVFFTLDNMDLINQCNNKVDRLLETCGPNANSTSGAEQFAQTQSILDCIAGDTDSNLDRILDQQSNAKYIIERDSRIRAIRNLMKDCAKTIEHLRQDCANIAMDMVTYRQHQREAQAKELERFQLQQLKFIADEQTRHQNIYEQRQKELSDLKIEYENEDLERPAYLMRVEDDLQREIRDRC